MELPHALAQCSFPSTAVGGGPLGYSAYEEGFQELVYAGSKVNYYNGPSHVSGSPRQLTHSHSSQTVFPPYGVGNDLPFAQMAAKAQHGPIGLCR